MADLQHFHGRCLCGAVTFDIDAPTPAVTVCHCRSCQRASGAASVAWAGFPRSTVRWRGDARGTFASSPEVVRSFCKRCGAPLTYQTEAEPHSIDVLVAALEEPGVLPPQQEIWLSHRIPWQPVNPALPGFQRFRSDG